jgi:Arc/MetJ family transcription regulator
VRRTSIELDQERLLKVQKLLGTTGVKDTVEGAFDEVIRADLRRRLARRIRTGAGVDRGAKLLDASRPRR